jgi:predicted signal transduction protein with EAL and GGDEF domain
LAQLDDFGTGFSALSYLHRFPIECLKIDQSFVAGLVGESRPESIAVVRAIQALAGTLGIHTIGEGVETHAQRLVLRELGCTYGQGYLFGRPAEAIRSELRIFDGEDLADGSIDASGEASDEVAPPDGGQKEGAVRAQFDEPDIVEPATDDARSLTR